MDGMEVDMEQLMEQIDVHDVICFDLFDTLLTRQIYDAEAVFDIVGERAMCEGIAVEGFREKRKTALLSNAVRNPTIYEIYMRFQEMTGITDRQRDRLLDLEIQTEKDVLIPRITVAACLYYAVNKRKRVFLVSDMYLPASIMEDILKEKGIQGYERIYISCDCRQLKYEGLFQRVMQETGGGSFLHVGDHLEYDGYWSLRYGMDYYHVRDMMDRINHSAWFLISQKAQDFSLNDQLILGKVGAAVFQDPFALPSHQIRPALHSAYQIGYCLFAPVVTHFMVWMNEQLAEMDVDGILFGARDGYLFQKLYQIMKEAHAAAKDVPDLYFLTSRVACMNACSSSKEDIQKAVRGMLDTDPIRVLTDVFQVPMEQIPAYDSTRYEDWKQFLMEQQPLICSRCAKLKQNYLKYMKRQGICNQKTYVFFDLASQGTCQHYLSEYFGLHLKGLYFWKRTIPTNAAFTEEKKGCYETGVAEDDARFLMANYLYLEAVLTDPDIPSVLCFTPDGEPVYGKEQRTEDEILFIKKAQQGMIDFFQSYIRNLWMPHIRMGKDTADLLFRLMEYGRTNISNPVWKQLHVVDDLKSGQRVPVDVCRSSKEGENSE